MTEFGRFRRGSVLMEFVLVAPLYFALLGGLFIVGGLLVNRMRMHMSDHLVTWIGASRLCPGSVDSQTGEKQKDSQIVQSLVNQLFDRAVGGIEPDKESFVVKWDDSNELRVNGFMGFYYGGITKLPVSVPSWIRGMLGMQGAVTGDGTSEWFNMETAEFDCGYFRSYSFHRLSSTSRSRETRGIDIASGGVLESVLNEIWIGSERKEDVSIPIQTVKGNNKGRVLGRFGE